MEATGLAAHRGRDRSCGCHSGRNSGAASFRMSLNSNPRKTAAFLHLHRHQNRTKAAGRMARACAKVAGSDGDGCSCCGCEPASIGDSRDQLTLQSALSCHTRRQALLLPTPGSLCVRLPASETAMTNSPFKAHSTATPGDRLYCSQPPGSLCRHLPRVEVLFPSFPESILLDSHWAGNGSLLPFIGISTLVTGLSPFYMFHH